MEVVPLVRVKGLARGQLYNPWWFGYMPIGDLAVSSADR